MRVLIAEDDEKLLKSLIYILKKCHIEADGVTNGQDAFDAALSGMYDGWIFDIMMPKLDGIELLKRLRGREIRTPALFLTAKTEIEDRVEGLDAGADDYLCKPFAVAEFQARVRAMLRRKEQYVPDILKAGDVFLNRTSMELSYHDKKQILSGKEFQLLEYLMEYPGQIFSTEKLLWQIWGWDSTVDSSVIWVHFSNIRKKLSALEAPLQIRFARGKGYVLEEKND